MSESVNNLGKDINFITPDSARDNVESKPITKPGRPIAWAPKTLESKEQNYKPVPVGELKLADLDNLDEEGEAFINAIILYVSSRMSPQVSEDILNFSFLKAVEIIMAHPAKDPQTGEPVSSYQSKFEDIARADGKSLKEMLQIVVPTTMPTSIENLKLTESVKTNLVTAVNEIAKNIQDYSQQNGDLLTEPRGVKKITNIFKSNLGIKDEQEPKRKELQEQLLFLDQLEDSVVGGGSKLTPEMLSTKVTFLDYKTKQYMTDALDKALEYGAAHIPSLNEYIAQLKDPEKLTGRILLNKVVDVFKKIAGGYAEPTSTTQRDVEFFKSGTPLGARTGSYARLQEHVVKTVNVKY